MVVGFTYDIPNQLVHVPAGVYEIQIQDLWDETQDWMDTYDAMSVVNFCFGSGKDPLGGSEYVGITLTFVDWRLKFTDLLGPSFQLVAVRGGNFLGRTGSITGAVKYPIAASDYTHAIIAQSTSPAMIAPFLPPECHLEVSYREDTSTVYLGAWLEREGVVTSESVEITVAVYGPGDIFLFSKLMTVPDSNGHFMGIAPLQTLVGDTTYYAIVTAVDGLGSVTTRRAIPTSL